MSADLRSVRDVAFSRDAHRRAPQSRLSPDPQSRPAMAGGGWLSFADTVTRCRSMAVCRAWRAHASDPELWTTFELRGGGDLTIDNRSLDWLIALAGGRMVSFRVDGLPYITADGLKRLRENVLLRHVSITNCIGEYASSRDAVRTPGITGRIAECLPPSVRVLHLVGSNVHAVADLPRLTVGSWELDVHECPSCAYVAHLPSQRRCNRCSVVRCGFRHNDTRHEWGAGCADDVACDTCGSLFCHECLPSMSRCQVEQQEAERPPHCSVSRCAACVAEHGPPTLASCAWCEDFACEDCLCHHCDFCDDELCTVCARYNMETCPRCESTYCSGCLSVANVSMAVCRSCKRNMCSNCDDMDWACTHCKRHFWNSHFSESYCRGCTPQCAGCNVMLCEGCSRHCTGIGCKKYYCDDCVPPTRVELDAMWEEDAPVRWAAMERLDLPRPKLCPKCDDMFCPDCWDCATLMPRCAACSIETCNACAKRAEECADDDGNASCVSCGAYICIDCTAYACKACSGRDAS